MNSVVRVTLKPMPQQMQRLAALQRAFAEVCNALAPLVQQTRCWNRVALHHMAYKQLRQQFPDLGSQMVCNAIYSVSRASRLIYQHRQSPFNIARLGDRPLPRLHFLPQSPVYFDRHTLSIKDGQVSMYTLDGRMRFEIGLAPVDEERFRHEKLREIVLNAKADTFQLAFFFAQTNDEAGDDEPDNASKSDGAELPEYLVVTSDDLPPPHTLHRAEGARPTP